MEEDAWKTSGRGFPAQVRVQAQGTSKKQPVAKSVDVKAGAMTEQEWRQDIEWQRQQGTVMETKLARSGSRAGPVQEQSGQSRGVRGHDGQVHQIPQTRTVGPHKASQKPKQPNAPGQVKTQQGDRAKAGPGPVQPTPRPKGGTRQDGK